MGYTVSGRGVVRGAPGTKRAGKRAGCEPGGAMSRVMAVIATLAAMVAVAQAASAADKLVLQLHGPAQFEFAGYYAALWQGFYRDSGLTVEIKPGAIKAGEIKPEAGSGEAPVDPVREVTEGRAQFGTGTAELVVRTAQGLPLLLLAPIFQQSGAAVYYRADADFASPGALTKAKLGRLPASDILDIELATALKAEGIDPGKLRSVALDPGRIVAALADRSVDAVIGSAWEVPWRAWEKGIALKSFNPADYRVEFYGDTLFTLRRLAKVEPQTVRSFRAASLKGWDYALQHPDEIAARLVAELPPPATIADAAGFARYQAELARRLARYPDVALGHSNPDRWDRIEASLIGVGALLRTADTDDFVYDPDAEARSRTDLRAFVILGATLIGGLAVTVWLWLRRRRQPVPAGMAGAAQGEQPGGDQPAVAPSQSAAPADTALPSVQLPSGQPPSVQLPSVQPPSVQSGPAVTPSVQPAPADLNTLLAGLERAIRQRVPRRIAFRLSLLPELWRCRAEAPTVRALMLDLVAAACADLQGNGELVVGTRNYAFDEAALAGTQGAQIGEYARVTVRDNGLGLSEEAIYRIFDPEATARPSAAAAAAAMRGLGGFARVESALGIGTAVHLYFPRVALPAEGAATPGKSAEAAA
jgi:ABC-type nitrate/sulfonate/bicarbonate transport system substrate-binding protein